MPFPSLQVGFRFSRGTLVQFGTQALTSSSDSRTHAQRITRSFLPVAALAFGSYPWAIRRWPGEWQDSRVPDGWRRHCARALFPVVKPAFEVAAWLLRLTLAGPAAGVRQILVCRSDNAAPMVIPAGLHSRKRVAGTQRKQLAPGLFGSHAVTRDLRKEPDRSTDPLLACGVLNPVGTESSRSLPFAVRLIICTSPD